MKYSVAIFVLIIMLFGGYVATKRTSSNTPPSSTPVGVVPSGRSMDLSGQNLTKVPASVFGATDTENLNLSNNALTGALPAEIRHLQQLRTLNLSNNKFTGVPAEIGQLKNLEVLNLSNNMLTGLPYELGNLSHLTLLDVSGNAYSEADLAKIRAVLPASTIVKTK